MNNYRDSNVIKTCVTHFISEKKPVAAMCAGIDFLRRFYGSNLLAREMEELTAEKFCFDAENNVYYTPAFRKPTIAMTALIGRRFYDLCVEIRVNSTPPQAGIDPLHCSGQEI